jgi:hypothetical protein
MASFLFNTSNSCLRKHQRIHTFSHAELCVTSRAAHGCANINNEVARGGVTRTWFAPLGHNVLDVSALNPNYDVQFMINKKKCESAMCECA